MSCKICAIIADKKADASVVEDDEHKINAFVKQFNAYLAQIKQTVTIEHEHFLRFMLNLTVKEIAILRNLSAQDLAQHNKQCVIFFEADLLCAEREIISAAKLEQIVADFNALSKVNKSKVIVDTFLETTIILNEFTKAKIKQHIKKSEAISSQAMQLFKMCTEAIKFCSTLANSEEHVGNMLDVNDYTVKQNMNDLSIKQISEIIFNLTKQNLTVEEIAAKQKWDFNQLQSLIEEHQQLKQALEQATAEIAAEYKNIVRTQAKAGNVKSLELYKTILQEQVDNVQKITETSLDLEQKEKYMQNAKLQALLDNASTDEINIMLNALQELRNNA